MRNLMSRHRQRGNLPQRHARQKRRGNEDAVKRVMNAVPNENQHPLRPTVVVPMRMIVPMG